MRANQLRQYLSVMAYGLVCRLRRLGLRATQLAHAQVGAIGLRLLKIGAQIRITVRKVWIAFVVPVCATGIDNEDSWHMLGRGSLEIYAFIFINTSCILDAEYTAGGATIAR